MKTVLLLVCIAFGSIVLLRAIPEDQSRLVLTPPTCAALAPQGLALTAYPGGCLYIGPVRRDFNSLGLGEIWVPRSAVIAEMPLSKGNQ